MVHLLSSERPQLAAASSNWLRALANWFAKAQANRARRIAYQQLLEYDQQRLDDLGINRQDLFDVLDSPSQRVGFKLSQKRAENSRIWFEP